MRGDCWSLLGIIAIFWAQVLTSAGDPTPCSCGTACPSSPPDDAFVDAATIIPHLQVNLRYATFHNFVGSPIDGYRCPRCILTRGAAEALVPIQKQLLAQNSSIKVYDCYRPQRAVDEFYRWSQDLNATRMKKEFYPFLEKDQLFPLGYIAQCSGHTRGSTLDMTIAPHPPAPEQHYVPGVTQLEPCMAPEGVRFRDNSLNFGTGFDCFSEVAHTDFPMVPLVHQRREAFVALMKTANFTNLPTEWWHFTWDQEPFPTTYFNFPLCEVN